MYRKNRDVPALLQALKKAYPDPVCALNHKNAFELLVATILSAQCTDQRVNMVTQTLFKKYRSPKDFADVSQVELEIDIRSTGFYRNKAKAVRGTAKILLEAHHGEVPQRMDDLLKLPGVARKTANVVLGTAYGILEGVVVDTHVARLSGRMGLTSQTSPEKIETDLMAKVPKVDWIWFSHALITHGRQVCKARSPECPNCPVRRQCANPVNL